MKLVTIKSLTFSALSTMVLLLSALPKATAAYTGQCATSQDIADIPPGHWCEVRNSHARNAEKKPQDFDDWNGTYSSKYDSYQGNGGFAGIMSKWSGGTFDTLRNRLLIMGGGHKGYGGNELVSFSLETLSWKRITDPVPYPASRANGDYKNSGTYESPISRHTYGGMSYIESEDKLFLFAGSGWNNGYGVRGTWTFDLTSAEANNNSSTNIQFWDERTSVNEPAAGLDGYTLYDSVTSRVFYHRQTSPGLLRSYHYASDTWTHHNSVGHSPQTFAVINPLERRIYEFNTTNGINLRRWDIPNEPISAIGYAEMQTGGDPTMKTADDPGIAFDTAAGKIVAYNGGTDVFSFDTGNNTWTRQPAANTNVINPGSSTAEGGIFGRFQYSRKYNIYVYVDNVDSNVFLYRLAEEPVKPKKALLQVR